MSKFKVGDTVKLISSYKRYYDFNYTICSQEFYKVVDLCEDGIKIDGCVYFMPSDHFEIIKENVQMKFTKDMLKTGMRVKYRNGDFGIILKDIGVIAIVGGYNSEDHLTQELKDKDKDSWTTGDDWDVVEVYEGFQKNVNVLSFAHLGAILWKREEITPEQQQLAAVMEKLNQLNAEAEQLQAIINKGKV